MDGRSPPQVKNEVLEVNGVSYVDDKDKAEQFAITYRRFGKLKYVRKDRKLMKKNRKKAKEKPGTDGVEGDITMEEMLRVINNTKANKAAGEDKMPYEFLKHLGPKANERLLLIYRRCWSGEGLPGKWRTAIIKPLLKEGKDPKKTASCRHISLTSCIEKVLEKIVADRLSNCCRR